MKKWEIIPVSLVSRTLTILFNENKRIKYSAVVANLDEADQRRDKIG